MNIDEIEKIELERQDFLKFQKPNKTNIHYEENLNIVFFMVWTEVCGGSKIILEYANRISERGHCVKIISYGDYPNWFKLNKKIVFEKIENEEELKNKITKCDLIIATSWKCIYQAVTLNIAPVVFFEQGGSHIFDVENLSENKRKVVQNRLQSVPYIYTVSSYTKEKLLSNYEVYSEVIPIAIDNNIFYAKETMKDNKKIEITIIGSENFKFKNINEILEAYSIIEKKYANIHLNWITQTVPTISKQQCIINPPQTQIADILRKTDIYICNSDYESFGLPTLEAMACGATVITTDTGGMRDFVVEGFNGLLIEKHNVLDIVNKIEFLINNPEERIKLAKNGLETAKKFSWEQSTNKTIEYYKNIRNE